MAEKVNRKRIICTVTNDLTYDQRMIRICTSLASAGYDTLLVGRELKNSKPIDKQAFTQKRLKCLFNSGKLFYLEYNLRLLFFLWFQKYNIVCAVDLDTILAGFYISKWKNKTCVYDAHEYFTEVPEVVRRPRVQRIWAWVARRTIPNLKHCYTVCESLSEIFEREYGTPFQVVRNVPFRETENAPKRTDNSKPKKILYQGALNEGRGIEQLIEAMKVIDGAELLLVGEGDLSQQLRAQVAAMNLENKVRFIGFVKPKYLKKITREAYIGVNLLENKGQSYYYSLANKAFDYIQADVPAVHMDFPEYQRLNTAHEVAVLIPNLERDEIVYALKKLLEDDALYTRLQANCERAKEEYIWEREEMKLLDFYENIS